VYQPVDTGYFGAEVVTELYWCFSDELSVHMDFVISKLSKHSEITGTLSSRPLLNSVQV
jgi:hypothetical protein